MANASGLWAWRALALAWQVPALAWQVGACACMAGAFHMAGATAGACGAGPRDA